MKVENLQALIDAIENDDQWDNRELGADEGSVKVVAPDAARQSAVDESVGLQMISIRLPKALIDHFKFLGDVHGLKYQTLMRQILARFAESEMKRLANKAISAQSKAAIGEAESTSKPGRQKRLNKVA
ncbi:MAG: hypothetical protein ACOYMG_25090 [Candidatus Methylumidiphilus sp.]